MSHESCRHGNSAPTKMLADLEENQAVFGRHKCPVCAYSRAVAKSTEPETESTVSACPHGNYAPADLINGLPESQGGSGRHKCAICAYAYARSTPKSAGRKTDQKPTRRARNTITGAKIKTIQPQRKRKGGSGRDTAPRLDSARAAEIGYAGELLVLEHERKRLKRAGLKRLSEKICHVAVTQGGSAGYDIHSYTNKGVDKFIEVKTTTASATTPIYLTANELQFSEKHTENYYLFRVYELDEERNSANFFVAQGDPRDTFELHATEYRASLLTKS